MLQSSKQQEHKQSIEPLSSYITSSESLFPDVCADMPPTSCSTCFFSCTQLLQGKVKDKLLGPWMLNVFGDHTFFELILSHVYLLSWSLSERIFLSL